VRFKTIFKSIPVKGGELATWRINQSGVKTLPEDAPLTRLIVRKLEESGIPIRRYYKDLPGKPRVNHLEAKFIDGGLYAATGNYDFSARGAWVKGPAAIEFVCDLICVEFPKKPWAESYISGLN
jgi:hypothetical protein